MRGDSSSALDRSLQVTLQTVKHAVFIASEVRCHATQSIGHNIAVMKVAHAWVASQVKPESMNKLDLIGLNGWRMWPDMEAK